MSSNSDSPALTALLEHINAVVPGSCTPSPSVVEMAEKARNLTIGRLVGVSDPVAIGREVDNAISWAVCAMASMPPFFSRTDLMVRYQKSRKWVEQLPIRPSRMGNSWLYPRSTVLAYEALCKFEGEKTTAEDPDHAV